MTVYWEPCPVCGGTWPFVRFCQTCHTEGGWEEDDEAAESGRNEPS